MTMSVTCDVRQVGHFHSTPSPWGLVNRLTKTIGFLHILQLGGSFFIGRFSVVDYRFCFLGFTAHAGPDCDSRLCAGTLFHDAATRGTFLTGRNSHDLPSCGAMTSLSFRYQVSASRRQFHHTHTSRVVSSLRGYRLLYYFRFLRERETIGHAILWILAGEGTSEGSIKQH